MDIYFAIILLTICVTLAVAWLSLAPWVPTSAKDLPRINKIAALKKGQIFYEIGCGNSRVCTYIARQNSQAQVIGIELAIPFYLFSKLRKLIFGPKNLQIHFGNALKKDLSFADVIYVFGLIATVNGPLKEKISIELKNGAKFISYVFTVKNWPGKSQSDHPKNRFAIHVYTQK